MTRLTTSIWEGGLQNVAAFMRSPDSLESLPLKAKEMMTTKDVEVHTASWAMEEEGMDRGGVVAQQCPQILEDQMPTNEPC